MKATRVETDYYLRGAAGHASRRNVYGSNGFHLNFRNYEDVDRGSVFTNNDT